MTSELLIDRISSPIGTLILVANETHLCVLAFAAYESRLQKHLKSHYVGFSLRPAHNPLGLRQCLENYFAGQRHALDSIPVSPQGTPFQQQVWFALRGIPWGQTCTYGGLANTIGNPTAVRAVGAANGQNPIAIVIPCHRVIGTDGTLTGYASGLDRKRWLLDHESGALPASVLQLELDYAR